ncbi:hypothetical protein ADK54_28500 [Streptomyces sp. WM6378]|nr:hypothetical protein ADK54_28500 [Streptomyces sp. WM6378]
MFIGVEAGAGREVRITVRMTDLESLGGGDQGRLRWSGERVGAQDGQGAQIEGLAGDRQVTQGQFIAFIVLAGWTKAKVPLLSSTQIVLTGYMRAGWRARRREDEDEGPATPGAVGVPGR